MSKQLPIALVAILLVAGAFTFAPRPEAQADGIADASFKAMLGRNISATIRPGKPVNAAFTWPVGKLLGVVDDHLVYKADDDLYYIPLRSIRGMCRKSDGTLQLDWR